MDEQFFAALRTQATLQSLSGDPNRPEKPAFSRLMDQCWRAREGRDDDGLNYMTMKF